MDNLTSKGYKPPFLPIGLIATILEFSSCSIVFIPETVTHHLFNVDQYQYLEESEPNGMFSFINQAVGNTA
jgi:hypothetical protein